VKQKLSLLIVLVLVFSAIIPTFAQDGSSVPQVLTLPEQIAEGRDVSITITDKPASDQVEELAIWESQVAKFTAMYPNVHIDGLEQKYDPVAYLAMLAGDQLPTLFNAYFTEPEKYIAQEAVADLTPFYEETGLADVFNPNVLAIASQDGAVYGIPDFAYSLGLAYNIELLNAAGYDAAPTTWDELAEMAAALTDRDNDVAGFSFINDGSAATGWHFTTLAYGFGQTADGIITPNGDGTYTANFAQGGTVDALNFVHSLAWEQDALPGATLDWASTTEALVSGRVAMSIYAGDQFEFMKNQFPDADINNFGYAPLPAGPNGHVALTGGSLWMINASASEDEQEAAFYYQVWRQLDPAEFEAATIANSAAGRGVGRPVLPLYIGDYQEARDAFQAEYNILPVENYTTFTDAVKNGDITFQPEPAVAVQEYYTEIGILISEILANEDVDPVSRIEEVQEEFQGFVLDQLG
jgi:multiple sugar transport system substrate-binding protein